MSRLVRPEPVHSQEPRDHIYLVILATCSKSTAVLRVKIPLYQTSRSSTRESRDLLEQLEVDRLLQAEKDVGRVVASEG